MEDDLLFRGLHKLQLILLDEALHIELGFFNGFIGDVRHFADVLTGTDPNLDSQVFTLAVFTGRRILLDDLSGLVLVAKLRAGLLDGKDVLYLGEFHGFLYGFFQYIGHHKLLRRRSVEGTHNGLEQGGNTQRSSQYHGNDNQDDGDQVSAVRTAIIIVVLIVIVVGTALKARGAARLRSGVDIRDPDRLSGFIHHRGAQILQIKVQIGAGILAEGLQIGNHSLG